MNNLKQKPIVWSLSSDEALAERLAGAPSHAMASLCPESCLLLAGSLFLEKQGPEEVARGSRHPIDDSLMAVSGDL